MDRSMTKEEKEELKGILKVRTLHGVPRNRRTLNNLERSITMQQGLSKGHLSEKHVNSHTQPDHRTKLAMERGDAEQRDRINHPRYSPHTILISAFSSKRLEPVGYGRKRGVDRSFLQYLIGNLGGGIPNTSMCMKPTNKRGKLIRAKHIFLGHRGDDKKKEYKSVWRHIMPKKVNAWLIRQGKIRTSVIFPPVVPPPKKTGV